MDQHEVFSSLLGVSRKVWVEPSFQGKAQHCLVFLDGELYVERVKAPEVIRDLQSTGHLPPADCVYLPNLSAASRHADFACSETFGSFAAKDLVDWIESTVGPHKHYYLCGLSLSGLAAAFAASCHPGIFSGILAQSPSAWWNDERFTTALLPGNMGKERFWISVGTQELSENVFHPPTGMFQRTCQLDSVRRLAQRLEPLCRELHLAEFFGGHDPICWKAELPRALPWLVKDGCQRSA